MRLAAAVAYVMASCVYYHNNIAQACVHGFNVASLAASERYTKRVKCARGGGERESGYAYMYYYTRYVCVCVKECSQYIGREYAHETRLKYNINKYIVKIPRKNNK